MSWKGPNKYYRKQLVVAENRGRLTKAGRRGYVQPVKIKPERAALYRSSYARGPR